uniref:PGR5-like protein 1A, chloroplastic n=1 Tax=Lotus japonicus TaxID=34305 RepID=I3T5F6_LOTJA|nr:unknown [Lotus japonicus]
MFTASKLAFTLTSPRSCTPPTPTPLIPLSSSSFTSSRFNLIQFNGRQLCLRRRLFLLSPKATADQQGKVEEFEESAVDSKIFPYCSIDKKDKKSVGEMEQDFLQALQSFYYEGKAIMSNEEFDNLKEELMWEGSSVVMLSSDEQKFLEASMAYVSGKPILSDKEYDDLKMRLKMNGSEIVVEGPRCSLRSRKVYSDLSVDYLKMFLLNVPATVIALGLFFFLDDLTGFEITYLLELPEPFSFIFTWFAAVPLIVWLALTITNVIIKDFLILKGPCPNCGTENTSFFGTILSIASGGSSNKVKCSNCATEMVYDSATRLITLPEGSNA